jgi:hypothetical protein
MLSMVFHTDFSHLASEFSLVGRTDRQEGRENPPHEYGHAGTFLTLLQ